MRMDGLRWHVLTAVVMMLLYSSRCFASSTTPLLWPVACLQAAYLPSRICCLHVSQPRCGCCLAAMTRPVHETKTLQKERELQYGTVQREPCKHITCDTTNELTKVFSVELPACWTSPLSISRGNVWFGTVRYPYRGG